jgi:O-antigen/teichoic acid export membrane protein
MMINGLNSSSKRTKSVLKNIYFSIFLRGASIFFNFILVPLTLSYLGNEFYGIWMVLLSIVSWLSLFDIGIGNGLRNKLTEALTLDDKKLAKNYISTAYFFIGCIGLILVFLSFIIIHFCNWELIFNIKEQFKGQLKNMMYIYMAALILNFIFNLISPILNAFQFSSLTNVTNILTSLFFIFLLILIKSTKNNITIITFLYCFSLITSNVLVNVLFFLKHKQYVPSLKYFNRKYVKDLLSLGSAFFVIQIAVLFIFTVDNFLVLQLLGPAFVSKYNVAFKLFSIFTIAYGIIMAPLWSAYTEAYIRRDYEWIRKTIIILNYSILPLCIGILLMIKFNRILLSFWIPGNSNLYPNLHLMVSLSIFVLISVWNNIYSFFLNGVNETRLQVKTAIAGIILNVPIAYFFVIKLNMGIPGVVWAMCISLSVFSIAGPIKSYKVLNSL